MPAPGPPATAWQAASWLLFPTTKRGKTYFVERRGGKRISRGSGVPSAAAGSGCRSRRSHIDRGRHLWSVHHYGTALERREAPPEQALSNGRKQLRVLVLHPVHRKGVGRSPPADPAKLPLPPWVQARCDTLDQRTVHFPGCGTTLAADNSMGIQKVDCNALERQVT